MKKEEGFTYLEIIIAFMIFGLVLVIILRVGDSVNRLTRASEDTNQMLHIAELELENYKTGIMDIDKFIAYTEFSIEKESFDDQGLVKARTLKSTEISKEYIVIIEEEMLSKNLINVQVSVSSHNLNLDDVVIQSKIIKDSE